MQTRFLCRPVNIRQKLHRQLRKHPGTYKAFNLIMCLLWYGNLYSVLLSGKHSLYSARLLLFLPVKIIRIQKISLIFYIIIYVQVCVIFVLNPLYMYSCMPLGMHYLHKYQPPLCNPANSFQPYLFSYRYWVLLLYNTHLGNKMFQ